jgi:hypothetical protein
VEVIIIKNENDYNFEKMIIKVKFKDWIEAKYS